MKTVLQWDINAHQNCPILQETDLNHLSTKTIDTIAPSDHAILISDNHVASLYHHTFSEKLKQHYQHVTCISFPAGEDHKTITTWESIIHQLLAQNITKQSIIWALGGGITLDLAGFIAATYKRGLPCIAVPTSLLAMVDACVGGKTGINTKRGKNLIGTITAPQAILIIPELLKTLPHEHMHTGTIEAIKHGCLFNSSLCSTITDWLKQNQTLQRNEQSPFTLDPPPWIIDALHIKVQVVSQDLHENGLRLLLNFGHTIAHAIEKASSYTISHGHAVAIGLIVESIALHAHGILSDEDIQYLHQTISLCHLPIIKTPPFSELVPYLQNDKKNKNAHIYISAPQSWGSCLTQTAPFTIPVSIPTLNQSYEKYHDLLHR